MRDPSWGRPVKDLPILSVLMLALIFSSCATREATKEPRTRVSGPGVPGFQAESRSIYLIKRGDQIQLSVWGYPEFATTTLVKETGTIAVPLVGEVNAAGFTRDQFSELMRQKLSEYVKGEVRLTINIVSTTSQKINVFGSVVRPQSYPVTSDVSLLDILTGAGGLTPESDLENVKIWYAGETNQVVEVNVNSYLETGNIDKIPIVHPGDTVFVPKRENVVRDVAEYLRDLIYVFGFFSVFR
jgi:polysaccharide export outer membrane protein